MSAQMETRPSTAARKRERELFLGALECGAADRAAFLDAECRGDDALRQRVEELLAEQEHVGSFLESPAAATSLSTIRLNDTALAVSVTEKPGDRIGRYKLLEKDRKSTRLNS